jgi:MFS family permease
MLFMFAMMGQFLVRSILAYDLTGSPFALGLLSFVVAIPMLFISPIGGALADRLDRRKLIMLAQILIVLDEVATLILIATGSINLWNLLILSAILGALFPLMMPARQAIIVNVVGKRGLPNAMAMQMGGMNLTRVLGPIIASILVAFVGYSSTFSVALVLYLLAIVCMFKVHPSYPDEDIRKRSIFGDIIDGFKYLKVNRPVFTLLVLGLVPTLLIMPFQALLVVFAEEVWVVGEIGFGVLQAAAGVGGIAGAFYVAWISTSNKRYRRMLFSLILLAATLVAFAYSPWFLLALPLVFAAEIGVTVFMTLNNTAIQLLIPDAIRGRVMALLMMSFGLTPLGTLPMAALAEKYGAPIAVASAAGLMLLLTALFFGFSQNLRKIDSLSEQAILDDLEREYENS